MHLLLPGLLWPAKAIIDLVYDLPLPALSWLLGKGQCHYQPISDSLSWQAAAAGIPSLPAAALRRIAAGRPTEGDWLCLDPISLRVERTQLVLEDPAALALNADESATLLADLAPLLAELGELHADQPGEWHLHLANPSNIRTTPLADAIGLNADQLMPQADNVRSWRRILNEAQMILHTHPVNTARSQRGLAPVNSLWPWGEGQLPSPANSAWTSIHADSNVWQGLAKHIGATAQPLPAEFNAQPGSTLVLHHALATATQHVDALSWRQAILTLENTWFAPLVAALQDGRLNEVVLHGHGSGHALTATINRSDRLRFWRKPAPLTALGAPA